MSEFRCLIVPEFRITRDAGKRNLRFNWSVANLGFTDFVGPDRKANPEQFIKLSGNLAVVDVVSAYLHSRETGLTVEHTGPAYLSWDHKFLTGSPAAFRKWKKTGRTGISPLAEVLAPGFTTAYPLDDTPVGPLADGVYIVSMIFDPHNKWSGFTNSDSHEIRIAGRRVSPGVSEYSQ